MKLLEFYTAILSSVDIVDKDGEGMLSAFYNGADNPVTVGGKRLVLPTNDILRAGNWVDRVAFHPLCEKITRTESPVLKLLKDAIGLRTDRTFEILLDNLMHTAASPELHKKIGGPKVAEYLKHIPDPKEKTYKVLRSILNACKQPQYRLVNYYLKHGGKGTDGAARTCVVTFPMIEELEDTNSTTVFGVKIDQKEKKKLLGLMEYVFGDAEEREMYSYGSRNPEAPYFHSLATSFYKVATRANMLLSKHKKHVENAEGLLISLDWVEYLDQFALFRGMIPALDGNEGAVERADEKEEQVDTTARTFNRPSPSQANETASRKVTPPWEEEVREPAPRREESRREPQGDVINDIEQFRAQFRRQQEEPSNTSRWGNPRTETRERGRGFADGFRDDNDRGDSRRSRDDDRGFSRSGGRSSRRFI